MVIADQATLSDNHKIADVVLSVTCPIGASPTPVRVSVRQNGASGSAFSATDYRCDGHAHQVVVPVGTGSGSFHAGAAQAAASGAWHIDGATSYPRDSSSDTSTTIQLV